jgi:MFS family permease
MGVDVRDPGLATPTASAGLVLLTLSSGQFLMALDSSVMNVSIATVAEDLGTTVTGIQTAITLYMLVMASLMVTGGKLGQIWGRKRAFAIGCVIYGLGSLTTALSPNLLVLLLGWSLLEGIGAALIMPAIVGLIAANFDRAGRPKAYGLVAAAAAIAVALGPLIGGLCTTYASWRLVFAGEVLVVLAILGLVRRIADAPPEVGIRLDLTGTALSALGLGLIVYGVLRAGTWGAIIPKPGAPVWLGVSPVLWLLLAGGLVLLAFLRWEVYRQARGAAVLVDPAILGNTLLRGGLTSFFHQYLLQSGLFFAVPLFLSVSLGLSAIDTGLRILPLSLALLVAATAVPKFFPQASPRRVVRAGFGLLFVGLVTLVAALDVGVGPEVVTWPMLLAGLGIGALASQLGSVTVSSVPDEQTAEVGGLQNTVTFLGAAIGTALAGAVIVSALTTAFFDSIESNPDIPEDLVSTAQVRLAGGVPLISDAQLTEALQDAGVTGTAAQAVSEDYEQARLDGLKASMSVLALLALVALFTTGGIPQRQPGVEPSPTPPRGAS